MPFRPLPGRSTLPASCATPDFPSSILGVVRGRVPGLEEDTASADDTVTTDIETEAFVVQINDLLPDSLLNVRIGKDHIDNYSNRPWGPPFDPGRCERR